ncbi:P22 phage major capsid protein family protein, partial [Streptomyces caeruleatus]
VPRTLDTNGNNVDNRTQQVTVSATTGVTAGSMFTITGIESVHQITKIATGQLKTFRVISVDSGTTMTISPPMIGANS